MATTRRPQRRRSALLAQNPRGTRPETIATLESKRSSLLEQISRLGDFRSGSVSTWIKQMVSRLHAGRIKSRCRAGRGLHRGQVGTVVASLAPGVFEVEFSDNEGRTYASLALRSDQLMVLHHSVAEVA